ncbi:MAG: hypothetical protein DMF06_08520 [Verrucomicrobia bacterium]|nr:MAG: hypothetical protein DMF06_08520 [Verrucomicrobiota bacterium]
MARRCFQLAVSIGIFAVAISSQAQTIIHVGPGGSLQDALAAVPEGGVIELAAGTYYAPSGGWTIFPAVGGGTKGFTIRAASGAAPVLSGSGSSEILTFTTPQPVSFENLTFADGVSNQNYHGGAMSMDHVQATFTSCTFQNNAANGPSTGGGALWISLSTVSFQGCTWTNNSSKHFGGALSADRSRVFIRSSQFVGNRVNVPGHSEFSAGGAINGNASTIQIDNSRFESNQAGYVGGAIYVYGPWQDPVTTPAMDLTVANCLFTGNFVLRDPNGTLTAPTSGGAIQLEDQTRGRFYNSRFINNSANQGGAIAGYRTDNHFTGCVFQNNQATGADGPDGLGGAIFVLSDDNADASTGGGTINRPSAKLTMTDCLIRGPGASASARQGGGIFVAGDLHSMYGLGVQQNGTPEINRASVNLTRLVFADLTANDTHGNGTGGALTGDFVTLNATQSIVENCGASQFGGGFELVRQSSITVTNTTFAGNTAGLLGGGLTMFGGNLNLTGGAFVENRITGAGGGSALMTTADAGGGGVPPTDMTGTIQDSIFSNNTGSPATIYDGYRTSAPFNRLQYKSNQIFPSDQSAYFFDAPIGSQTVAQVNALTLTFADNSTCVKAPVANIGRTAPVVAGAILMVPATTALSGAPGETVPIPAFLGYASSGGAPLLDGAPPASSTGVISTPLNGSHTLAVGGLSLATVPPPAIALNISTRLPVGTGQGALIGGLIIQGATPKNVIIRAIGPSLPVAGALQDPVLELHDATGAIVANNDNWRSTQIGGLLTSAQSIDIQASAVAPSNDAESAIVALLNPGAYTAVVRGANNATGIAVVEAYDLDAGTSSKLANISTRGFVQTGDNVMIGGFILGRGTGASSVVIRGIGPSLVAFGISNPLSDPMLDLYNSNGTLIDSNDDWRTNQAAIMATGLQPSVDAESALLMTNPAPGAYTTILRGKNSGTGVGVIEVYNY